MLGVETQGLRHLTAPAGGSTRLGVCGVGSLEEAVYALRAVLLGLESAPVAQLDRAAASEAVGQTFESSRAHHFPLKINNERSVRDVLAMYAM